MQEGSGEPSPENVRPIKGRDSVTVERCGENMLDPMKNAYNTYKPCGLTITYLGDNLVHLKGTYQVDKGSFVILNTQQKLLAGRRLKITGFTIEGTKQRYTLYGLRTENETAIAMQAEFTKGDVIDMTIAVVVSGSTPPTAYSPYTGQTSTLTLPTTIYDGTVDAVTGEGQKTWKLVTFTGNEKFYTHSTNAVMFYTDFPDAKSNYKAINSHHSFKRDLLIGGIYLTEVSVSGVIIFSKAVVDEHGGNIDGLKAWLAAQYAAGTPVQVCYKLAKPVPFTATGAQPIPALSGINTVLTDSDSVTVTGRADPIKRITDLEDAVASMT